MPDLLDFASHLRAGAASPEVGTVFRTALPVRPRWDPSGTIKNPIRVRDQLWSMANKGRISIRCRRLASPLARFCAAGALAMLGPDALPRGVQIIAASFEDRTAIACAAMLEALGACFKFPPINGLALRAAARLTSK